MKNIEKININSIILYLFPIRTFLVKYGTTQEIDLLVYLGYF